MKTALCGTWHVHAEGYFDTAARLGEVVGVWEENEQQRRDFCRRKQAREFSSFQELLDSDAEGVIVCAATGRHEDLIIRLAEAGKHIFTEKVLALTDEACAGIAEAVTRNHVRFVISLPQKYLADRNAVKQIAARGELGNINYIRFRNCHSGSVNDWLPDHFYSKKECGGGAMVDLGAHGMYLTDWICGKPDTYSSVFTRSCRSEAMEKKNRDHVEDNAVTVMSYRNGCIAVNETGFVSNGCPAILEVGGDKGYVRMDNNGVRKSTADTGYHEIQVPVGEDQPLPIEQFMTGNILPGCGIEDAKNLTHMMVMAYRNIVK